MRKVLVLEDEENIRSFVVINLKRAGYETIEAGTGEEALALIKEYPGIKVALLDIMLPGLDGYELLDYLRPQGVPVIFITAKGTVRERVEGLRRGADDYIVKPFVVEELLARVESVLRRAGRGNVMQAFDVVLDAGEHTVLQNGRPVDLTPNEFLLLEQLMRNRGAALYRDTLYERVWGGDRAESDTRTLDLHIMRLRRKLHWYDHIETVYRIGYRLKKEES